MKVKIAALFLLLSAPLMSRAEQLVPAGSLIQCTVSEPKLSSKTAAIGDPVLCQISHLELYGRSTLPYGSYLEGRFEDYKDPGHLVGRGWMELKFDRMIIQPDIVIPVSAKVVYVPGYPVDRDGKIHGKGHLTADVVEWSLPILWPIDLINLPRRGPRPTLKEETRITLKLMDDLGVPSFQAPSQAPSGLIHRDPTAYVPAPQPAPTVYAPTQTYVQTYVAPPPRVYAYVPPPVAYFAPRPPVVIMRNGYVYGSVMPR